MRMLKKALSVLLAASIIASVIGVAGIVSFAAGANSNGGGVSRVMNGEGIVLLKNENDALPLSQGSNIAIFGEGQHLRLYVASDFNIDNSFGVETLQKQHGYIPWGAGSSRALGAGGKNAGVDPLDAFNYAEALGRVNVYDAISQKYVDALEASNSDASYVEYVPTENDYNGAISAGVDTAIVMISRWDGECVDLPYADWELTDNEISVLQNATEKFDKVIVVLNTPTPIDTSWCFENALGIEVDAVLFAGYGGMQGGWAIADVILGDVNPSGKLTTTYAKELEDYPTTESFVNDTSMQQYKEDIFLGYRYFETFDPNYSKVNFEFGFGLSYTDFDIEVTDFSVNGDKVKVLVKVTNTGAVAGKEVVQLYVSAPQGALGKAGKVLCAFDKTVLLSSGASETLTLTCDMNDIASYDDLGKTGNKSAYVLEAGDYEFYVGNSVKEAGTRLAGINTLDTLKVVEQLSEQVKTNLDERLLADGTFENLAEPEVVDNTAQLKDFVRVKGVDWFEKPYSTNAGYLGETESFTGVLLDSATQKWSSYTGKVPKQSYMINSITYKVNVEEAGKYYFTVRAASNANASAPIFTVASSTDNVTFSSALTINGAQTHTAGGSAYYSFADFDALAPLTLSAGVNYIKIGVKNAPNVESFTLTKSTAIYADSVSKVYIPAAYYHDLSTDAYAKVVSATGSYYDAEASEWKAYFGNAAESLWSNGYVSFAVNVKNAGNYKLAVRASSTAENTGFDIKTSTDGSNYTTVGSLTLPENTYSASGGGFGQYFNFKDVTYEAELALKEGINYIRFSKKSGVTISNIAGFSLEGNVARTDGKTSVTIEGEDFINLVQREGKTQATVEDTANAKVFDESTQAWVTKRVKHISNGWTITKIEYQVYSDKVGIFTVNAMAASNKTSLGGIKISSSADDYVSISKVTVTDTYTASGNQYNGYKMFEGTGTIKLNKGMNTLKLEFTDTAPNVDFFTLVPATPVQEDVYQLKDAIEGAVTLEKFVQQMTDAELASFYVSYSGATNFGGSNEVNTKYGFSRVAVSDGPSGIGSKATSFPCETIIACTWNTELVEAFGRVMGAELYGNNIDVWLAPGMNLHRNPLSGRNSEYYSEDPYLSGVMATVTVKAVQEYGVSVCIKHFVCNEKEHNKLSQDVRVSERALREIYLKPFEMCVKEGKAQGIMSSYNHLNGTPVSQNYDLLTNILRGEWGYEYYISGDWNNDNDMVAEVNSGHGVREPYSYCDVNVLISAIEDGEISRETLVKGVVYQFNTLMKSKRNYTLYSSEVCGNEHQYDGTICSVCNAPDPKVFNQLDAKVAELAGNISRVQGYTYTASAGAEAEDSNIRKSHWTNSVKAFNTDNTVAQVTLVNVMASGSDLKVMLGVYVSDSSWSRVKADKSFTFTSEYDEVYVNGSGYLVIPYGCSATVTQDISSADYDTFVGKVNGVSTTFTRDQYGLLLYLQAPTIKEGDQFHLSTHGTISANSFLSGAITSFTNDTTLFAPGAYEAVTQLVDAKGNVVENGDQLIEAAGLDANSGNAFVQGVDLRYVARATENDDYAFVGWFDESGALVSDKAYYAYNTSDVDNGTHTLYARYRVTANAIAGASVDLGESLTVKYYAKLDDAHKDAVLRVTRNSSTVTLEGTLDPDGYYVYSYEGVNPQCMTDNIRAELVLGDEVIAIKDNYSVKAYCNSLMSKTAEELEITEEKLNDLKVLLSDMLVYGAESQKYVGYKTDELATDGVAWLAPGTFNVPSGVRNVANNSADNKIVAAGLNMANVNRIYFRIDVKDDVRVLLDGVEVEASNVIYTDGILATEFGTVHTLEIYNGAELCASVEYNVNAYVQTKHNSASVGALVKALSNYGASANEYIA